MNKNFKNIIKLNKLNNNFLVINQTSMYNILNNFTKNVNNNNNNKVDYGEVEVKINQFLALLCKYYLLSSKIFILLYNNKKIIMIN